MYHQESHVCAFLVIFRARIPGPAGMYEVSSNRFEWSQFPDVKPWIYICLDEKPVGRCFFRSSSLCRIVNGSVCICPEVVQAWFLVTVGVFLFVFPWKAEKSC